MKLKILEEIIQRKNKKNEFSVITNLETGNSKIFLISNPIDQDFADYEEQIKSFYKNKTNGIIKNTNIFIQTFTNPIKVIVVGAVHIAQYIVEFTKNLNFEIILINDDVDDKNFINNFSKIDHRIRLLHNDKNLGAGLSRNKGMEISKGEYIAFCDCDDLWKSNKIELQLEFMKYSNFTFSFTSYDIIDENNNFIKYR